MAEINERGAELAIAHTSLSINIPPRGYEELAQLAAHSNALLQVLDASKEFRLDERTDEVSEGVSRKTGIAAEDVQLLLTGIANLHELGTGTGTKPDELLKTIIETAEAEAPEAWSEANLGKLREARSRIADAVGAITKDHPFLMRQKAKELTYAHQNIFRSSRIITDLRPVFNASGDEIEAMVLTHVLGIEYHDGVRLQRIEFALDEADVRKLRNSTERALLKTETTMKAMEGTWQLIVAGTNPGQDKK